MVKNEIQPRACPFCGCTTTETKERWSGNKKYIVNVTIECARCGTQGPLAKDSTDAVGKWNHRCIQIDLF